MYEESNQNLKFAFLFHICITVRCQKLFICIAKLKSPLSCWSFYVSVRILLLSNTNVLVLEFYNLSKSKFCFSGCNYYI